MASRRIWAEDWPTVSTASSRPSRFRPHRFMRERCSSPHGWLRWLLTLLLPLRALVLLPHCSELNTDNFGTPFTGASGIGGVVGLELNVGADGTVTDVKVTRSAGFGLDEAAVAAAKQFKFRPATRDGALVESTILFDQQFKLRPRITAEVVGAQAPTPEPAAVPEPVAAPDQKKSQFETTVVGRGPTTAASSTTIRNLDFDLRPKTSPNDVLRVVPGLLAVQHQGGGKADQLFLRGFDADHGTDVGVFIDGIPVNMPTHAHGQGFADLHWLIPEALERIDVVKGQQLGQPELRRLGQHAGRWIVCEPLRNRLCDRPAGRWDEHSPGRGRCPLHAGHSHEPPADPQGVLLEAQGAQGDMCESTGDKKLELGDEAVRIL